MTFCVMQVSDPAFVVRLRDLAARDPIAARAVVWLAHDPEAGGRCRSYRMSTFAEAELHTVNLGPGELPGWELLHLRARDDVLTWQLAASIVGPVTPEQRAPLGAFALVDVQPGYALVLDTSTAPDWETIHRWQDEASARRKALLRRYTTTTPDGRARAIRELLGPQPQDGGA